MFPVAPFIVRTATADTPVSSCIIPKNSIIMMSIFNLQRVRNKPNHNIKNIKKTNQIVVIEHFIAKGCLGRRRWRIQSGPFFARKYGQTASILLFTIQRWTSKLHWYVEWNYHCHISWRAFICPRKNVKKKCVELFFEFINLPIFSQYFCPSSFRLHLRNDFNESDFVWHSAEIQIHHES